MKHVRVLLVDDHEAVAKQLRKLLEAQFEVIATVADGYAMVGASLLLKPDVIVADIGMPGIDGMAAATWIMKSDSAARIVFATVHAEPALVQRAMELGAMGYVLKLTADETLVPAVEAAMRGERYVSPQLAMS